MQRLVLWNKVKRTLHCVYTGHSGATKYYRSHYNQWCCLHRMLRGATNLRQKTAAAICLWRADTNFKWFSTIALWCPGRHQLLWRVRCRHGVTHLSRRNKATSASDCRPSAPWVLLPYRSTDGSTFVFYPPSLSFCHSAWLFIERSLLHIMSRHAPYCWLAASLFWYSALSQFSKAFLKNYIPSFNWSMLWRGLRSHYMCTVPETPLQAGQGMVKRTALDSVQSSHTCEMNWTLGVNHAQAWIRSPSVSTS